MSDTHLYGYTMHDGELVTGSCTTGAGYELCFQPTSHQCHGDFYCLQCLQHHLDQVVATYAGCLSQTTTPTTKESSD